jgi:hypothetical protein
MKAVGGHMGAMNAILKGLVPFTGDRKAAIAYPRTLEPVRNAVAVKKAPADSKSDW